MKFGCCINMIASGEDKIGAEHIGLIKQAGYDYLEMPLAEITQLSDSAFEDLLCMVQENGLPCEACNNLFPASVRLTGQSADSGTIQAYLERAIPRAAALGAKVVVFGSGGAKRLPDGFDRQQGWEQVVAVTKTVCTIAAAHGITIAIEPLRKPECNIINSFAEGVQLAQAVNLENCRVLVDFYHLTYENEELQSLLTYGPAYLRHVHFANPAIGTGLPRIYPDDPAEWNYAPFAQALEQIGYQHRVSVEAYCHQDLAVQAAKTLQTMKRIFAQTNA